ncbi:Ig-like domain-containing protein [Microbacterium stercoris]|uniref:Tandem-95 repeat protein n=1 Tax=Microbacterium stercoris TaxID=2820289 RepID=A0A939QHR7_9MICO|nr:Ig-like domain-containing protein [Microbacterium stercoris]MBO3662904.1 tandem-95 repeat protein [Microbacterium stercoris]
MGVSSWLNVRPRTLIGASIVSVAAIGITTMAVAYEGNPTTELELHDGAVWITKKDAGLVGHFNAQSKVLDGKLYAITADYDVLQDDGVALVHDLDDGSLGRIDDASVAVPSYIKLPPQAQVEYAQQSVAILDPAKGSLYVQPLQGLDGFEPGTSKPLLDKLGDNAVITVGLDGTVYAASPEKATLYTIPVSPEGSATKDDIRKEELAGVDKKSELALTSVGDRPVVLEQKSGTVLIPGREAYELGDAADRARLAQDAPASDAVLIATRDALVSLPLDGSEPTEVDAGEAHGTPAAPVWLGGCAYSAWMGTGRFVRDCVGDDLDLSVPIEKYEAGGELVFRVNRDVVMLNDVVTGGAWLASESLQKVDNWDDLTPPKGDGVEEPDPTTVQVPDPTPPDRGEENHPPVANDDSFGVRAGSSTILPVLTGSGPDGLGADSDPDGDVLVVTVPEPPSGVEVQPINDGTALQITVPAGTTSVQGFDYEVSDGRPDGTDTGHVGIDVTPEGENSGPVQLRKIALPVETGSTITYNVLPDWIDPDGDNLFLQQVAAAEGDTARFTADGRIVYRALSGNIGPVEVSVTISDGESSMVGVFLLEVFPPSSKPPLVTPDHLVVREGQLGTVNPLANDLSASDAPVVLTQVSEVMDAEVVPDYTDGTFTFRSGKAGTYYVDYKASTSGTEPVPGLVRVDVLKAEDAASRPPVAVRDVALLPSGGDALVNVLANDSDPAGGVLVVQSVTVPDDSHISVSVLNHETLRVTDAGLTGSDAMAQARISYTISNGNETAMGEVVVLPMPAPPTILPPVVNDDEATVRAGDIVTIPVLDNDYHPNDREMSVVPELDGAVDTEAGLAFVSQAKYVRFRAGDEAGDVTVTYVVEDENGQRDGGSIAIHILPVDPENNNAPRPATVEARALAGSETPLVIPLDGIDPDGDSVEYVGLATGPKKGRVESDGHGGWVYQATKGMSGLDTFTYSVRDALGAQATGTIRIGIAPKSDVNQEPFAVRDSLIMKPGRVVAAPVRDNDSDPDGDKFDVLAGEDALILGPDPLIEAEVQDQYVVVTAPDEELETSLQYTIEDARGAQARGVLQVTVDEDAPLLPPVARDDFVLTEKVDGDTEQAVIDLRENDTDPDGTREALDIALVDADEGVVLDAATGTATVTVFEKRRLVQYEVTDVDGQTAQAFLHVPGLEDLRPQLASTEPLEAESGKTYELPLADYVRAHGDKSVRLTATEKVAAAHSNGGALVLDEHTLTYTSADRYSGGDALTFEVTDGASADDPDGRVSILSIPITVLPPANEPPEMAGGSVTVGAGDAQPGRVDLAGLATDIDQDPISFQIQTTPEGIDATLNGSTLEVKADADAKGTTGDIVIVADDGQDNPDHPQPTTAEIAVTVTASTRELPVATDDTFDEWDQGTTKTVDVLGNDVNPFADEGSPLEVIDAQFETGSRADAEMSFTASGITITPNADFHGRLVIRYTVQDKTQDPDRTAQARVNVTVQGRPETPIKPRVSDIQSHQLTLDWDAPADNGAQITGYKVTAVKGDTSYTADCPSTTCILQNLKNNVTYAFQVVATNRVGDSDPSPVSQDGRPDVRPETPAAPTIPGFGDGSLTVAWARPATDGSPVTDYTLEITPATPDGVKEIRVKDSSAAPTRTITGLANGTSYSFRVRAHNLAPDPSEWSAQSARNSPARVPDAPGTPTAHRMSKIGATPGDIQVTWPAITGLPADGGDPVDLYSVQAYQGGAAYGSPKTTAGTSATFSLPVSGAAYTFRVQAKNKAGWGAWSADSTPLRQFTSPTAPGTPTIREGDRSVALSWAPATAQGADEVRYQYLISGGSWTDVGTATSVTVNGLQNGAWYKAQVRAYAVAGGQNSEAGPASGESASVSPYGRPFAPAVSASRTNATTVVCSWDASGSANGRPVSVQARFFDGNGWQNVGLTGSRTCASGYDQTGRIEVVVTANPGGQNSRDSGPVSTSSRPASGSVSYVPTSEANPNGVVNGCTNTCKYLRLTYQNVPQGTYNIACQHNRGGWQTFATESRGLSGNNSEQLRCAYGFANDVRVVVSGPADFIADN